MKKSVFLKVVGILLILEGVVNIFLALAEAFSSFTAENGGFFHVVPLMIALCVMVALGVVSIICGAYGDTNWKNPKNMRVCLIWGAVLLVGLVALSVYTWLVLPGLGIATLGDLILPILYLIAAAKFRDTSKE